jgi:replicative DNA helicase
MTETIKYPYSAEYQTRVLAVILRDREFSLRYQELLQPTYFDNNTYVELCRLVFKFIDEHGVLPSRESILNKVRDHTNKGLIERLVDTIYSMDLTDSKDVEDTLKEFVQQQSWRLTQPRIDLAVREGDFSKARELFDKNMRIDEKLLHEHGEIFYFDNIEKSLLALEPSMVQENKIATLITPIDRALKGGTGKGEIHILFAPRKTGKSIFLCNIVVAGLYQKKNVLLVSLELGGDQIEKRIHTRITGIPDFDLYDKRNRASGSIKRIKSFGGQLVIKKYPTRGATVNTIRNYMDYLWKVKGFSTDLLVVDYLDVVGSSEKHSLRWMSQGPVTEDLRGLAGERDIPCWSVTQADVSSEKKDSMEGTDMKGDSVKAETADSVWSLLQTAEEFEVNRARLFCNYLRDGAGMFGTHTMVFNKRKMLLTECKE